MIIFGKTSSKPNFLFGKLPFYFKQSDSYKDGNNEGLLERYLEIFCQEIDNEMTPFMDEVLDITNAEALPNLTRLDPTELLTHISSLFGNPPDIGTDETYSGGETEYIKLIRYITYILRTKGTIQSLIYYLAIYGYKITTFTDNSVEVKKYDPGVQTMIYDSEYKYDNPITFFSDYDLIITDVTGTGTKNPPQAWLDNYLKPAIQNFINPLFSTITSISYTP